MNSGSDAQTPAGWPIPPSFGEVWIFRTSLRFHVIPAALPFRSFFGETMGSKRGRGEQPLGTYSFSIAGTEARSRVHAERWFCARHVARAAYLSPARSESPADERSAGYAPFWPP